MRATAVVIGLIAVLAPARPAGAQALGTFAWQVQPYCNIVRFTVTPDGAAYRLTGFDEQCGAGQVPAAGAVTPNADGTYTLAFYLITPQGRASHTTATLAPGSYSGPWKDTSGLTGTLAFGASASPGGAPRPVAEVQQRVTGTCPDGEFVRLVHPDGSVACGAATGTGGGDITGVAAGAGLAGGGASGDVTLAIAPSGVGSLHILDGSLGATDVDTTQIQRRVTTSCGAGLYFVGIDDSGAATCSDGASGTSTALGQGALSANAGFDNTAVGYFALRNTTTGHVNTAMGRNAMAVNTTGEFNTAIGTYALMNNTIGEGNTVAGAWALTSNTFGDYNTALGTVALTDNTTGLRNVAVGAAALSSNTTGIDNVAVGEGTLRFNTVASYSTGVGTSALQRSTGGNNTGLGWRSGYQLTTGFENTALGYAALPDATTGARNIAIGTLAGGNITTGSDNIHIGFQGAFNESDTIRIGVAQTRAFVTGIRGVTTGGANAVAVLIDSAGQLGTISSSRRTKEDIHDMGAASAALFRLRPVTFRYIQPYADGSRPIDYGLIAEEVEEVFPDLVVRNEAGAVETVQYHKLVPMLLNELQRLRRDLDEQRAITERLQRR